MLPRKELIHLKDEFARLRKTGKVYDSTSFGLLVSYSSKPTFERVAFIVSKKVSLKSVDRHAVKRKLADMVKPYLESLSPAIQLVFLAKSAAVETSAENLRLEFETTLKRAQLLS